MILKNCAVLALLALAGGRKRSLLSLSESINQSMGGSIVTEPPAQTIPPPPPVQTTPPPPSVQTTPVPPPRPGIPPPPASTIGKEYPWGMCHAFHMMAESGTNGGSIEQKKLVFLNLCKKTGLICSIHNTNDKKAIPVNKVIYSSCRLYVHGNGFSCGHFYGEAIKRSMYINFNIFEKYIDNGMKDINPDQELTDKEIEDFDKKPQR